MRESDGREDESGQEEEEWSEDVDNLLSDDDWSDEDDDDLPPDFDEDGELLEIGQGKTIKQDSRQNDEMVLLPVLPDGRPREQW